MRQTSNHRRGFSLLEIAIVFAVIGLMIGAIFGAQIMLRNQRIKEIPSVASQYLVAAQQFRVKYGYLPGDFPSANEIWATATNGDGNNLIDSAEPAQAFSQLSNGGFIVGTYGAASPPTPGTDIPAGPIEGSGYSFSAANAESGVVSANGSTYVYDGDYTAAIYFGKTQAAATFLRDPVVSGEDAWVLDRKYDDGVPGTGQIVTWRATAPVTNTAACTSSATAYDMSIKTPICSLIFLNKYLKTMQ